MINYDRIKNIDGLCANLGTTKAYLEQVLKSPILQYTPLKIPKRDKKGWRDVYLANDFLRPIQKIIRDDLAEKNSLTSLPDYIQGFVKNRSICTNAQLHLSKRYVVNLDIKSYFESIKKPKVAQVFCSLGASEEIANILAELCTCNGYLVPGTVCAPVISNLAFADCDRDLFDLANESKCAYSRYVDDITFSGDKTPPLKLIDNILKVHGFVRNTKKTYHQRRGLRQYVTGLTVFDKTIPRIPKWKKQEFRKIIYFVDKFGLEAHLIKINSDESPGSFVMRLEGLVSFYRSIEPSFIRKYESQWQRIKDAWERQQLKRRLRIMGSKIIGDE